MKRHHVLIGAVVTVLLLVTGLVYAQGTVPERETKTQSALETAFTYQGQLSDENGLVDGPCDLTFQLYDAAGSGTPPTGGNLLGTVEKPSHDIVEGLFTVQLDFGSGVFDGEARWLQIEVDCGDGPVTLSPRQALTAAPYALYSTGAPWSGLSGVPGDLADGDDTGEDWALTGNGGTTPGTHFLGTTDDQALELRVDGGRALRLEPDATSPNVIGGYSGNGVTTGAYGTMIGGGGETGDANSVTDNYGVVAGGRSNQAGDDAGTTNDALYATVGGGYNNLAGGDSATVGGGAINSASGWDATVPGGSRNAATGDHSFAAGRQANALHDGSFVWADSAELPFASTRANQFNVRATNGVRFETDNDSYGLLVNNPHIGGDGVYVDNVGADGVYVRDAGDDGVSVASAGNRGVAVNAAEGDGVYVCSTGDRSGCSPSSGNHGLEVGNAQHDGVHVIAAQETGVNVTSAGWDGVAATGDWSGVNAQTTRADREWAVYAWDKIYAAEGYVSGASLMLVAQSGDSRDLETGDLVALSGIGAGFAGADTPVPVVQKLDGPNSTAAVGVVYRRFVAKEEVAETERGGAVTRRTRVDVHSTAGSVGPGDHLLIVVIGPAQVKADSLQGGIGPGDELTTSERQGHAMKAEPLELNGVSFYPPGTTIGKAMEPLDATDETGLIWTWVTLQ